MTEKNIVSVETQTEYSITTGQHETRIFFKVYVEAAKSGLIADMGAERWQTLCILASFMNEKGECYPTQEHIASRLGVSRQAAAARLKRLIEYRWQGRELVRTVRKRDEHTKRWENTRYTVLPISQVTIFNAEPEAM